MAGLDFANIDWGTVAGQACGPGTHWNGQKCVPDAVEQAAPTVGGAADLSGIDWAGLGAQARSEISPYNEDPTKRGQYSEGFNAAPAAETDEEILARFLDSLSPESAPGSAPGEIDLMGDLMGDPALGYSMDPSGYRVNADGYIVGPEGDVTNYTPWQVSQQDPAGFMEDYRFKDERPAMRDQAYADALAGTGPFAETGPISQEDLDQFLGVVGTEDWFQMLADDPAIMDPTLEGHDPALAQAVLDAQGRLDETGTATLPWVDSPEFAAKYGSVGDPAGGGDPPGGDPPGGDPPGGDPPGGDPPGGEVPAGGDNGGWADPFGDDEVPPGVPVYVNEQVDAINIVKNQLKDIKDAHKKLLDSGLANIDEVEQALTDAESDIYARQYGVLGPDGEVLTPGEMDRLLSTWDARRSTTKKNRASDRAEILSIMTDEGVPAGLAQSELDMIDMIHGDSVDAQYDYIDSLWRIGKMSHDERTSMIGNMMSSYRLQLRDTLVEMVMAEEISAAGEIGDIRQTALEADTMADLFEGMTENQVFALMSSGMSDLLQLPEDDAIGMITTGEWAGYTSGQKANVLMTAGYTQNADGTFSPPAADAVAEGDKVLSKLMPDGTTWSGTADEYYDEHGEYIFAAGDEEITQDLPDGTAFTGTVADYVARSGVYPFAAAAEQDDPNTFTVSVDRINELDPTGAWLRGSGLQVIGARKDSAQRPGSTGFVTMNWDDWVFTEDPYEAVKEPEEEEEEARKYHTTMNGEPWYGTPQEYTAATGKYMFAPDDPAPVPVPSSIMEADFPGLLVARPNLKVVDGEYWLTPEDINVYGQIVELREDPEMDFGEMLRNGAYPGHPVPINMREQVQAMAVRLQEEEGFELVPLDQLYITAVLMEAPVNENYARLAAKYLGVNVDVNDSAGAKTGHIDHTTGEFIRIGNLQTYP